MNKSAFLIFTGLSLLTGIAAVLIERAGIELSLFILVLIALGIGIGAAVVYAKRVKSLIKQIVVPARSDLQIYNLPYASAPGMDDIESIARLIITKTKESEEQLKRNIDDIRQILDIVDIGILVVNRHGRIVYANEYMKRFASLGRDLTGIYFLDVIRSYEAESMFNAVVAGTGENQKDISLFTPGEKKFSLGMKQTAYCTPEACYLMTLRDITRLTQAEVIRQDFITNASHELKTPLTSIIGYLEALQENYNKEFVAIAHKNAKRMQRIVDDMLILSRADRGAAEFTLRNVSISDVIAEIQLLLGNELERMHQRFTISIPDNADIVYADREALFHILLNLIDNAVKYNNEQGSVAVSVLDRDTETEIMVQDSGAGIPSNELDRIFERFYTVDKARSRALGGTGLGLSIVRHFVLAHNGRVWVESTLNKGSCFHFTIPKKK